MYSVDCCPKGLVIGKQGENEAEKVAVDFSPWASEFGAGTISARLRRPKDSAAYPVVLTTEGTTATWTVSATDTQYAGAGSLQLVYIVGDVVAKSVIWPVRVLPSLEEGEAPEPYESWLDTLEGLAADTQENARDAAASAADASASAEDAAQSAQSAAESAASITGLTAVAETLPEGSEASASFDSATDTLTLGIPKGDTGAAGPAGPKGDTGADGFSPSATVTKQDGNIVITVTDKDGTTSETLEVDDALDEDSVNPVQNAAIVEAMRSMLPVDTASGSIASFPDGADDVPMLSLKAQIEPVQDLHGYDHPWSAGKNINKITVNRTEGLLDGYYDDTKRTFEYDKYYVGLSYNNYYQKSLVAEYSVGNNTVSLKTIRNAYGIAFPIAVAPNTEYFVGATYNGTSGMAVSFYDADGGFISYSILGAASRAITTPVGCVTCVLVVYDSKASGQSVGVTDVFFNSPSSETAYSPYSNECPITGHTGVTVRHSGADMTNPDVIPVSWEPEAGTVYGGELDVVSGKLTVDKAMVDLGTLNWAISNHRANTITALPDALSGNHANCICSVYKSDVGAATRTADMSICLANNGYVYVYDTSFDGDAAAFKTAMNGVQLVYELAEPIEYTLTPQEVRTFFGQNNIWSDTGNTEVTYRADIQKFIEKKVTE